MSTNENKIIMFSHRGENYIGEYVPQKVSNDDWVKLKAQSEFIATYNEIYGKNISSSSDDKMDGMVIIRNPSKISNTIDYVQEKNGATIRWEFEPYIIKSYLKESLRENYVPVYVFNRDEISISSISSSQLIDTIVLNYSDIVNG